MHLAPGRIIGRKGQALESLQLLVNRMMQKADAEFPHVLIDIDGYSRKPRERRKGPREDRGDDGERRERRDSRDNRGERGYSQSRPSFSDDESAGEDAGNSENEEILRQQALDAAKEVKRWGDPVTLAAMNSHDRRIIHITLQEDKELKTESLGDGNLKRIVISLATNSEEKTEN